jgi:hypothetical protein
LVKDEDDVLVFNTGNGLKDIAAAQRAVAPAPVIEPTLQALQRILPQHVEMDNR